jgi:hypothetical protein
MELLAYANLQLIFRNHFYKYVGVLSYYFDDIGARLFVLLLSFSILYNIYTVIL